MRVYLVGGGPGDPELITLKAHRLLQTADVVLYDSLIGSEILNFTKPDCIKLDVGKKKGVSCLEQQIRIQKQLVHYSKIYETVIRLKGGDPFVFGRGGEEVLALSEEGVEVVVVPGISSGIAVPAMAGIPVTHRGISASVAFFSGHLAEEGKDIDWNLAAKIETAVFFMGVRPLKHIISKLIEHGRAQDSLIAIIEKGTCKDQKEYYGTLDDILGKTENLQSPAIIIVGDVVGLKAQVNEFKRAANFN